jgi:hypothetical protein
MTGDMIRRDEVVAGWTKAISFAAQKTDLLLPLLPPSLVAK